MKGFALQFFTFIDAEKNKDGLNKDSLDKDSLNMKILNKAALPKQYKRILIIVLVLFLFLAFGNLAHYYRKSLDSAQAEAEITANRLVSQLDERLANLERYYISIVPEDAVQWILDNTMKEMDYNRYKATYDRMVSKERFSEYVSDFTLVNFSTGWVLNNRGLFEKDDISNFGGVLQLYKQSTSSKKYWNYQENGTQEAYQAEDNKKIDIDGLSFVLPLPMNAHNTYAFMVAGIDMDLWWEWHKEWESAYDKIVVLDEAGSVVYATDDILVNLCTDFYADDIVSGAIGRVRKDGHTYMASAKTSDVLKWNYYIFHDVKDGQVNAGVTFLMFMLLLILIVFGVFGVLVFSFWLYHSGSAQAGKIMHSKDVHSKTLETQESLAAESDKKELEYLKGSLRDMHQDKQALEHLLGQQQEKILELFELRLMRGEVDNEEWEEYLNGLNLRPWKCFATVVSILNFREEEVEDMINEDVICLKILQEMPAQLKAMAWMPPTYNAGTVFAIFAEEDENTLFETIKKFCEGMQACAQNVGGFHVMMGVSATHTDYHHIRTAYHESINAFILHAEFYEQKDFAAAEEMPDCRFYLADLTSQKKVYDQTFENNVKAAVKALDKQQCYQVTDDFCRYLCDLKGQENELRSNVYLIRYVNAIMLAAIDLGIDINQVYPEDIRKMYLELLGVAEPDRERRIIKWKFIDPIIRERLEYLEKHSKTMIESIERMIAEKNGNISLPECADALGVHVSYIWKILKMERNKSFSDYVEEYKLAEAKRLLLETECTVAEIAERLNYTNAQNFIRFFSKSTGVTPGKFRKLY